MEHLIKRLTNSVALAEKEGENTDSVSWGMQEGILISYNEAKVVIEALKALSQKPIEKEIYEYPKYPKIKCHCTDDDMREDCWATCDYGEHIDINDK